MNARSGIDLEINNRYKKITMALKFYFLKIHYLFVFQYIYLCPCADMCTRGVACEGQRTQLLLDLESVSSEPPVASAGIQTQVLCRSTTNS